MKAFTRFAASLAVCGLTTIGFAQESDSIFDTLDKNEDGLLVADEVSEAQMRFFERLIRAGDENEDGKLSKAEYQATLKEDERPAGQPAGGRDSGGRSNRGQFDPGAIFDRMDTNKDGKLEKSELPEQARDRMGRLFDQLGKDTVTKEEYTKALSQMMRNGRPGGEGQPGAQGGRPGGDFFKQLDKNKDGKISKDEIPEQMRERMAGLFERIGKDEISLEELAKMRQQREGSRPEGEKPEGERREGARPDGERGERKRSGGDSPEPEMRRRGDGNPADRPEGGRPGMGPGGPAFMRVLDENRDGRISKAEALNVAKLFVELDKNNDGELDGAELMGFQGRPGGDREGMERRPEGDRPEGDRPRPEGNRGGFGPEAFMARFDKDKDGSISKEEAPGRMAENFDQIDENGDGKLTADEFGKMFSRGRPGSGEGRERGERGDSDRPKRPEAE
jgi:Ca2+-binding EF-hand superfamily protein